MNYKLRLYDTDLVSEHCCAHNQSSQVWQWRWWW